MKFFFFIIFSVLVLTVKGQDQFTSILYNGNLNHAALGFSVQREVGKVTFFIDTKIGGHTKQPEIYIKEWSEPIIVQDFTNYSYGVTQWGSYVSENSTTYAKYGEHKSHTIINGGIGLTVIQKPFYGVKLLVGVGVNKEKTQLVEEKCYLTTNTSNLVLADYYESSYSTSWGSRVVSENINYNTNLTVNVQWEWSYLILGAGFDTKPMGVNLIVGVRF
jgi:hypothetical protein